MLIEFFDVVPDTQVGGVSQVDGEDAFLKGMGDAKVAGPGRPRWLKDIETIHPVPLVVTKLEDANFGLVGVLEFGCEIAPAVGTGGCGPSRQKNAHDLKERMKSRHSEF